jgi:hypothetical protein
MFTRRSCNDCGFGDCDENDTRSIREIEKSVETPCPQCGNTAGPKNEPFFVYMECRTDNEETAIMELTGCINAYYFGERLVGQTPYVDLPDLGK